MNLRTPFVALSAAMLFAACSPDVVVAPMKAPTGANLAMSVGSATGSYIVLFKGNNIDDFSKKVAALGGTVTFAHAKVGFATMSGVTPAAAAKIGALSGITSVVADVAVGLETP